MTEPLNAQFFWKTFFPSLYTKSVVSTTNSTILTRNAAFVIKLMPVIQIVQAGSSHPNFTGRVQRYSMLDFGNLSFCLPESLSRVHCPSQSFYLVMLHKQKERLFFHYKFKRQNIQHIFRYEPGDHIAIYPENNASMVEQLGKRLAIDLEQVISLDCIDGEYIFNAIIDVIVYLNCGRVCLKLCSNPGLITTHAYLHYLTEFSSKKNPFPCPTTFRTALTHYVDICTPPRSNVIKDLAQYATDENEKAFLLKLSSNEGKVRSSFLSLCTV